MLTVTELAKQWNCQATLVDAIETNKLINDYTNPDKLRIIIYNMQVIKANGLKLVAGKTVLNFRPYGIKPHIRLHPALFDNNDEVSEQRNETFFHEIAHQIAYKTKYDSSHGAYWAYCLIHFGFPPERCYDGTVHNFRGYKKRNEIRGIEATVAILDEIGDFEL